MCAVRHFLRLGSHTVRVPENRSISAQQRVEWSEPTTKENAYRRGSGRRRHNAQRRADARLRQALVYQFGLDRWFERGWKAEVARQLGVHRSAIGRDYQAANIRVLVHDELEVLGQAFVLSSRPGWERYGRHRRSSILPRGALTSEMSSSLSSRRSNRVDTILEHGQLIRAELPPQWEELAALARDLRVLVAGQDRRGTGRV